MVATIPACLDKITDVGSQAPDDPIYLLLIIS